MRLIDADALKALIDDGWGEGPFKTAFFEEVDDTPTIDPVKHGKWVAIGNTGLASCKCGYVTDRYSIYNYCPNCGAKMDGGEIHDHYNCTGCGFMSTCTDEEAQQCLKPPHISQ